MGKHDANAKKIHLSRIGGELTKCGRMFKVQSDGTIPSRWFVNPDAKLCVQCENLAAADGLAVNMTWEGGHWRIAATPPQLMLATSGINTVIRDQNDPEAPPVVITHDKLEAVLGDDGLSLLYEAYKPFKRAIPSTPTSTEVVPTT